MTYKTDTSTQARENNSTGLSSIALLVSTGTLVCCALPIILVSLGLGATVVTLTSTFPFLITLSQNKLWVFIGSAIMLAMTALTIWRSDKACPTDPTLAEKCYKAQRASRIMFWSGVGIWCIGFTAAYLALPIRIWLDI